MHAPQEEQVMSKVLLICNTVQTGTWLKKLAKQADFVLAADGGANVALAVGIIPDAVIGDLDSVSPRTRRALQDTPFIHVKRQDNTDLEKALDWITAQRFDTCFIVGATGGRLDFTLGNILAVRPYLNKIQIQFCGPDWTLFALRKGCTFQARKGARCSFIPLSTCKSVSLKGMKYCVKKQNWDTHHIGRSLSNQITAATSQVSFTGGLLLMYLEH